MGAPKNVWIRFVDERIANWSFHTEPDSRYTHYILAPEPPKPKREVLAWVVKKGECVYWYAPGNHWTQYAAMATRYRVKDDVIIPFGDGVRVVRIVRKAGGK